MSALKKMFFKKRFYEKDLNEWVKIFSKSSIPMGPINDMKAVFEDEQVKYNNIVQNIKYPNSDLVIRVPGTNGRI
jgi:crotonobetainyl-CoA:carnitine CoA-transferase CaiB-like acyl-CoA transferase